MCSSLFMWDDFECAPLLPGCGTQHPLRALGGTRVLLAAAPTTPPCFRRWRRSSSLQRKDYFIISEYRSVCGRSGIPFSREGFGTNSLSQSLTALPAPSGREPLARPGTLHFRRKLYRHAKCPIPEDDFPRPMPDSPKGEYPFRLAAARQATFPKGTAFRGGGTVPG